MTLTHLDLWFPESQTDVTDKNTEYDGNNRYLAEIHFLGEKEEHLTVDDTPVMCC